MFIVYLTPNDCSFWTWSCMSDLRGDITTVIPGATMAGSW